METTSSNTKMSKHSLEQGVFTKEWFKYMNIKNKKYIIIKRMCSERIQENWIQTINFHMLSKALIQFISFQPYDFNCTYSK